jgi:hypothetical protein
MAIKLCHINYFRPNVERKIRQANRTRSKRLRKIFESWLAELGVTAPASSRLVPLSDAQRQIAHARRQSGDMCFGNSTTECPAVQP